MVIRFHRPESPAKRDVFFAGNCLRVKKNADDCGTRCRLFIDRGGIVLSLTVVGRWHRQSHEHVLLCFVV